MNDGSTHRRCGQVWGSHCDAIVHAPDWSHDDHPSVGQAFGLAADDLAAPELLELLSSHTDHRVLLYVAGNPNTPPATLNRMYITGEQTVQQAVINNPSSPPVLRALSRMGADHGG